MKRGLERPSGGTGSACGPCAGRACAWLAWATPCLGFFSAAFFLRSFRLSVAAFPAISAGVGRIHSALPTTRRSRLQLSLVLYVKSLKRRADWPVFWLSAAASAISPAISLTSRGFWARPKR